MRQLPNIRNSRSCANTDPTLAKHETGPKWAARRVVFRAASACAALNACMRREKGLRIKASLTLMDDGGSTRSAHRETRPGVLDDPHIHRSVCRSRRVVLRQG